jgi:hypothetical protein
MVNKFIGCNIFFRFKQLRANGIYKTNYYSRIVPINRLRYIDYDYYTKKTHFYFDDCSIDVEGDVIKVMQDQISNGYNIIDLEE